MVKCFLYTTFKKNVIIEQKRPNINKKAAKIFFAPDSLNNRKKTPIFSPIAKNKVKYIIDVIWFVCITLRNSTRWCQCG